MRFQGLINLYAENIANGKIEEHRVPEKIKDEVLKKAEEIKKQNEKREGGE